MAQSIQIRINGKVVEVPVTTSIADTLETVQSELTSVDASYSGKKLVEDSTGVYHFQAPHGEAGIK